MELAAQARREGVRFDIVAGYRSPELQAAMHRDNPSLVAAPESSKHPKGLAVDVSTPWAVANQSWRDRLAGVGLQYLQTKSRVEPWHLELLR